MSAYEVGRSYTVPCVLGKLYNIVAWWPVIGQMHEDAEHIGFAPWHWHVDYRFVSDSLAKRIAGKNFDFRSQEYTFRALPLMLDMFGLRFTAQTHPRAVPKRRLCKRQYTPLAISNVPWSKSLESSVGCKGLQKGHCPHRGVDLASLPVDRFGCIECPLHGLVFRADTGAMVPREDWMRWHHEASESAQAVPA